MHNFTFEKTNTLQRFLIDRGVKDFEQACTYVKALPYGRNEAIDDKLCVIKEGRGTCSTKHALLKRLATESRDFAVKLQIVIFEMNEKNTPKIGQILKASDLKFIPEAHMYLKINGEILDVTFPDSGNNISDFILSVSTVGADQATKFKVNHHQQFIKSWLKRDEEIELTFDEVWAIREECIALLSE